MSRADDVGIERVNVAMRAVCLSALLVLGCDGGRTTTDGSIPERDASVDAARPDGGLDGAAPDGGPVPTEDCPGTPIVTDGALALDVAAVRLQGEVTVGGEPLPDGARGSLVLRGPTGEVTLALDASDAYRALVVPGDYELHYAPAGCAEGSPMPCTAGRVAAVSLRSDGVLDVDIPVVTVRGTVRVDGAVRDPDGATLAFGAGAVVSWDAEGAYEVRLIPGRYAIELRPGARPCTDGDPLPCAGGIVREEAMLGADGVLDVEVTTALVRGLVRANGRPAGVVGTVELESEHAIASVPFDASGAYAARLLAGRYDVRFPGSGRGCGDDSTELPCNGALLLEDLSLASDGVLDLDVESVEVRGRVTVNGAPPASAGQLTFTAEPVPFDASGDYRARLARGTYDIAIAGAGCTGRSAMPCNGGVLRSAFALSADGVLDLDVPAVTVEGNVTVEGAAPSPGALVFEGAHEPATAPWSTRGAYAITLLGGTYDVAFRPVATGCPAGENLPCHGGRVASGVSLTTDGVLDAPIDVVRVTGAVRAAGAAISSEAASLRFRQGDEEVVVAPSGDGAYAVRLAPGAWDVDFVPVGCASAGMLPCTPGRVHTGASLSADGVLDVDVPRATVTPSLTVDGAALAIDPRVSTRFAKLATAADPAPGEASWAGGPLRLFPGTYVVTYDGGASGWCEDPSARWPCLSRALLGCGE